MDQQQSTALVSMSDIERAAKAIAASNLFGIKTPDQALALMLVAQAEGYPPALAARDYHVIQGRPSLKADAMLARFQQAGGRVQWQSYTDTKVGAEFSHPAGGTITIEWTMERAKAAGLTAKDNWKSYPRQMLRARVVSEGIRTVYPACVCGTYTPEEVQDMEPLPQAAPAKREPREVAATVVEEPQPVAPEPAPESSPTVAAEAPSAAPAPAPAPSAAPAKPAKPVIEPTIEEVTYVKSTQKTAKNGNHYWVADFLDAAGKQLRMTTWDTKCGEIINALAADDAVKIAYVIDNQYKTLHKIKRIESDEQPALPLPPPTNSGIGDGDLPF